jgi:lipoprotein-releasing system permease protein
MKLTTVIALRYLKPRRLNIIGVIGMLSMIGIAIGTAALIVVMSIFNGFRSVADQVMIGFGPHLRIIPTQGSVLNNAASLVAAAQRIGSAMPVVTSRVVIQRDGITAVATANGVPPSAPLGGVRQRLVAGLVRTHGQTAGDLPGLVMGIGLAEKLQTYIGDTVTLLSPEMIEQALTSMVRPSGRRAVVQGIYQANTLREIDHATLFTADDLLHSLTRRTGLSAVDILVDDPQSANDVASALRTQVGDDVKVLTWNDLNEGLYNTMQLERIGSFIVLALIIVVAAFNVLVTLTLGVGEKRRDIALLKTMGATDGDVARIFRLQGIMIGAIAVVVGATAGSALVLGQRAFQWIAFDPTAGYLVPALPVELHFVDVALTAVTGLCLAGVAAVYPARRAARAVVADGIRVD